MHQVLMLGFALAAGESPMAGSRATASRPSETQQRPAGSTMQTAHAFGLSVRGKPRTAAKLRIPEWSQPGELTKSATSSSTGASQRSGSEKAPIRVM